MSLLIECLDMRLVMFEVFRGLVPLLIAGFLFGLLPWNRSNAPLPPGFFRQILQGSIAAFLGLTLFLHGVNIGFLPVGKALGEALAFTWDGVALIPYGFFLGFTVCAAEPTVSVLGTQVENATAGTIPKRLLVIILCMGVALATCIGMARLLYGWPILWLLFPGYMFIIILSRYCSPSFVAIAYDASTVVTGPMVCTFVMAVALGAANALEHRDPLLDGFGLVALIAMVPIMAVMLAGHIHYRRGNKL